MMQRLEQDAASLREDLYRVIHHYAELSNLAQQSEVNPIGQIGKILQRTSPYLLVIIRDLLPLLEKDSLTYPEALHHVVRSAQRFPDHEALQDSREEIQKIEEKSRLFVYAVKWLESPSQRKPSSEDAAAIQQTLIAFNTKYKERYAIIEEQASTVIPWFLSTEESEPPEVHLSRVADLVRRGLLELFHLMITHEPTKKYYFFANPSRIEVEEDLMRLAWFLFRSGYPVERIATGYHKEALAAFLNEKLLDHLLGTRGRLVSIGGVSMHLNIISLIDFASFFEIPADYRPLEDGKEISNHAKKLKAKNRRGGDLLGKVWELLTHYASMPHAKVLHQYLLYQYYSSFGDYHGTHRIIDPRVQLVLDLYKPILNESSMNKRAEEDLEKSSRTFSTKTRDQMAALLKLIMSSLTDPSKVKGKKVKVLGDISSGAMGKVSIGIYKNQIVALKIIKTQAIGGIGDVEGLLEYEAAINAQVHGNGQHPYIAEYYGLVEQDSQKILINGYYPCDNLTQLVEKNWHCRYKPPFVTESKLTLATMEAVIAQLLNCLQVFKKQGIVHRDLKTDNILYTVDEGEQFNRLKVIDFGVARAVGQGAVEDMFKGKVVGTFAYMAPEQARSKCSFQSDLYSVGAIFTVLLTGKLPMVFPKAKSRKDLIEQLRRIEKEPRPKLATLNPFLEKHPILKLLAAMVEKMLDLNAEQRPKLEQCQGVFAELFRRAGKEKDRISIFYHRN